MNTGEAAEKPKDDLNNLKVCRFCRSPLQHSFADLGVSPLANSYLDTRGLSMPETFYPLHVYVCGSCFLVQLEEQETPENIFTDYAYFSSYSESWLEHTKKFAREAKARFKLDHMSRVLEIGSNDGHLLSFFKQMQVPVTGVDPACNVAEAAKRRGVETWMRFFDAGLAEELNRAGRSCDLLVGNNVLAQIPDLNGLMEAVQKVLKPGGVVSIEVPHLLNLVEKKQFDTIYHEHYSYFSLIALKNLFSAHGFYIFDVDSLETHGGSLRVYACREKDKNANEGAVAGSGDLQAGRRRVEDMLWFEEKRGLKKIETYQAFSEQVKAAKREILKFLIGAAEKGKKVAAYGAPAKGNTLLNYCGIGPELVKFTVDRSPHKQGLYLPGSRIPVYAPQMVEKEKPDYLVILPWNLQGEITGQMEVIRQWGGQFVVLIPEIKVC